MITLEITNVNTKITGLDENTNKELYDELSYEPDDAEMMKRKMMEAGKKAAYIMDFRKRLYMPKRGQFPTGLLTEVKQFLNKRNLEYVLEDKRIKVDQYHWFHLKVPFFPAYPHQVKAMDYIKANPCNAISVCTGGGKTQIALEAIKHWGVNVLIIVPTLNLKNQFIENLEFHFGNKFVGTHEDEELSPITVSNIQGIVKKDAKWFKHFDGIIIDECHHSASDSYTDLNKLWGHITNRLFLSATLFRNDGEDMVLKGLTGDTTFTYTAKEAITDGFIVRPKFFIYPIKHFDVAGQNWHIQYEEKMVINPQRNKKIVEIANKLLDSSSKRMVILVNRLDHADRLAKMFTRDVVIVTGETKHNEKVFAKYRRGEIRLLIATSQVFSEGIDVPNIDILILTGGYTSEILISQSVGRVIRLNKEENKKYGIVIDFLDQDNGLMLKHSKARLKIYKNTFFKEDISIYKS